MKILVFFYLVYFVKVIAEKKKVYQPLGCWKSLPENCYTGACDHRSSIPKLHITKRDKTLSHDVIEECADQARGQGYTVFAIRNGKDCFSGRYADLTYKKYGSSSACVDGLGGVDADNVYSLTEYHWPIDIEPNDVRGPLSDLQHDMEMRKVDRKQEKEIVEQHDFSKPRSGTNLLGNPGFEDSMSRWNCGGDSDTLPGGTFLRYEGDYRGDGGHSGMCKDREGAWAGPGQFVGHIVEPGHSYKFSAWTRQINANTEKNKHDLQLWLRFKVKGEKERKFKILAKRFKFSKDDGWVYWTVDFTLPHSKDYDNVYIYYKGPKKHIDILIDDASLMELEYDSEWKEKTDQMIEKHRKRDVKIRLVNFPSGQYSKEQIKNIKMKIHQSKSHFAFGSAVHCGHFTTYETYRQFFLENFEWVTLESHMKWPLNEPHRGVEDYELADKTVELLQKHGVTIRGHCVYWAGYYVVPPWLRSLSSPEILTSMDRRLGSVVPRYKGKVVHWDVLNEMLHGSFFLDRTNDPYVRYNAFNNTRRMDPGAKLFLNDFHVIDESIFTGNYLEQIKDFASKNVGVEGVGVQGHFTGVVNPAVLKHRLDVLSQPGIPIWLTELDIYSKYVKTRANSLETILRVSFSHPGVEGIIMWGWTNSWRGKNCDLTDGWVGEEQKVNEAGKTYQRLRKLWRTDATLTADKVNDDMTSEYTVRGFHGDYRVTIELPGGKLIRNKFQLPPGEQTLNVDIDIQKTLRQFKDPQTTR